MPSARAHAVAGALAAVALMLLAAGPSPAAAAYRCYSYAVRVPNAAFGYKAGFPSWVKTCDANSYNISRLYMKYSCVTTRDNNFLTRPTECPGGLAVMDGSTETCSAVFGYGPPGTFTQASQITGTNGFDSGNVCNGGDTGYFFILVDDAACPGPNLPAPKVVAAPYGGKKCNRQGVGNAAAMRTGGESKPLSKSPGKIAGISIGAGLGLLILTGGLCWLIYYMSQRANGQPSGAVQSAMMGMGGGGGGGGAAGRPGASANLPAGSYVPGATGAVGGAAAAGGPGGYSYKPGASGDGGKPAAGMPLNPGAGAGGAAPGKAAYPKV